MKILVVDDIEDARIILKMTLKSAGYNVQDAENGVEALKIAKDSPPDMIISDILMPEMDGYKLCREIKQNKKLRKIPFIFYSSTFTTTKDEKYAEALGASRFIIKPVEPVKFLKIIQDLISEHSTSNLHVPRMPLEDDIELAREHEQLVSKKLDQKIKVLHKVEHELSDSEKELKRRLSQQAIVAELGQQALEGVNTTKLLNNVSVHLVKHFDVKYSSILELLPLGKQFILRAGHGWTQGLIGKARISTGMDSQAGYCLITNKPVILEDLKKETRFSSPSILIEHKVISGMSVVIYGKKRPFGVLSLHSVKKRTFNRHDVNFLQSVANILGQALEHRRADEGLRLFRDLIDQSNDSIFIINPHTSRILDVNETASNNLGYSHDELQEMSVEQIQSDIPESMSWHDQFNRVKDSGHMIFQTYLKKKDNNSFPVDINVQLISRERKDYIVAVARDMTERIKIEQQLKEKLSDLEKFYNMAVGRELKMKELKAEIHQLKSRLPEYNDH